MSIEVCYHFDTLLLVNVILMGTLFSTNGISKSSKLCNLDKTYVKGIYVILNELNLGPLMTTSVITPKNMRTKYF